MAQHSEEHQWPASALLESLAASALATLSLLPHRAAQADVVTDWNVIALNATAVPPNSILQSRALAIVHAAIYDAVRAVDRKRRRLRGRRRGAGRNLGGGRGRRGRSRQPGAARACGAADAGRGAERQPLQDSPTGRPRPTASRSAGKSPKRSWRCAARDGADAKVAFTPKPGAGLYQLTPPQSLPAILPQWGAVTPFVLRSRTRSRLQRRARLHDCAIRARLRGGQECGRAQQHDADCGPDRCGDFLDRADGRSLACRRARRIRGQGPVAVGKRPVVRAAVHGHRGFADRRLRGEIQAPALAADHRHPRGDRPRHPGAQGRCRLGAAAGDAAASRIPFRACGVFRCRRSCAARLLRQ